MFNRNAVRWAHRQFERCESRLPLAASVAWIPHMVEPIGTDILIDVDTDGDLDRLIPDDEHPERPGAPQFLNWRENLGSGAFAESARVSENVTRGNTPIFWDSEIKRGEYGHVPSLVVDLDQDGDQDVLVGSMGGFSVSYYHIFINDQGLFSLAGVVSGGEYEIADLDLGDVDADGDLDILLTHGNIAPEWLFSLFGYDDLANSYAPVYRSESAPDGFGNAQFADVDVDGDLDVVTTIDFDPSMGAYLGWYENLDGKGTLFDVREIASKQPYSWSTVTVGELNGDGFEDILWRTATVDYFPGTTGGLGPEQQLVDTPCPESASALAANLIVDVDGDEDSDLMCRDRWFENVDRLGNFDALANEIPILDPDATRADYDGDGDLDVYGNGWWLENRRIGDANNNGAFDSADLTAVLASGKYDSGAAATFDEGDWNLDGRFDSKDLVYAFQIGGYRP